MIFANEKFLLVIGTILPLLWVGHIFLDPRRTYAPWAKMASILVTIAGLVWGLLGFLLINPHQLHIPRHTYFVLLAYKHTLSGVALGFIFSIWMARPYQKTSIGNPPADFFAQFFRNREKDNK